MLDLLLETLLPEFLDASLFLGGFGGVWIRGEIFLHLFELDLPLLVLDVGDLGLERGVSLGEVERPFVVRERGGPVLGVLIEPGQLLHHHDVLIVLRVVGQELIEDALPLLGREVLAVDQLEFLHGGLVAFLPPSSSLFFSMEALVDAFMEPLMASRSAGSSEVTLL